MSDKVKEDDTMSNVGCISALIGSIIAAIGISLMSGCVYKGAKVTEGTDLSVGISVPGTEGAASLTVLNWLSGFRVGLSQNAQMEMRYRCAETNDYFGIIHTRLFRDIEVDVTPTSETEMDEASTEETEVDGK